MNAGLDCEFCHLTVRGLTLSGLGGLLAPDDMVVVAAWEESKQKRRKASLPTITSVEDLKRHYRRAVPKMFFDYAESGSFTETTFKTNEADFSKVNIRQRVGIDVSSVTTETTLVGQTVSLPIAFAPIGLLGMQYPGGEIVAARAARDTGIPFILSTMSICSIEQVAEAIKAPFWFQLYVVKDRVFVRDLMQRAKAAGCSTLVITMDLSVFGQRHKDIKNRLSIRPNLRNLLNIMTKPRWAVGMAMSPYKTFGNVVGHAKGVNHVRNLAAWTMQQVDPALEWSDIEWIRDEWDGDIVLKGILDVEDAETAKHMGISSIIVSNHGGRQLDGARSSIRSLPLIAEAVGDDLELILDSGVRTGIDVFRARALGASGVLLGRAMVYALGAMGEAGLKMLIEIMRKELRTTMALAGKTDINDVGRNDVFDNG